MQSNDLAPEQRKHKTLIIGGGPAGLASAMILCDNKEDFLVLEKQPHIGGLSKTYTIEEDGLIFRTDYGPHRFFSKNKFLYQFIENILDEQWIQVNRVTRQYIKGKFYDYPVNGLQVIKNIGPWMVLKIFTGYIIAIIQYRIFKKPIRNFYDYIVSNFGKPLGYFNMINYTEKIWGISSKKLHEDWARQRITGLSVTQVFLTMMKRIFSRNTEGPKTLVNTFFYPEYGTGMIYEKIREKIESKGYKLETNSYPTVIKHDGKRITHVKALIDGKETEIEIDNLIESVYIDELLPMFDPAPPQNVLNAAKELSYRYLVMLFVTLDKDSVGPDQWLYFPDTNVPFARMSEMKNFSPHMVPEGKTSVLIEFFCDKDDDIYSASAEELLKKSLAVLEPEGFFKKSEVRHVYRFTAGKDYPIYTISYKEHLDIIKKYLDSFENLYYIGRPGRFKYTNQDQSLEMGILAGQSVVDGKRHDIESVANEQAYFEQGYNPHTQ